MKCGIGPYGYSIGIHNESRDPYMIHLDMVRKLKLMWVRDSVKKEKKRAASGKREWSKRKGLARRYGSYGWCGRRSCLMGRMSKARSGDGAGNKNVRTVRVQYNVKSGL